MGTYAQLSFAPTARTGRALRENDLEDSLMRSALGCGMAQADWSWKGGVVRISDAELRSAAAWEPFIAQLRSSRVAYDEVYEAEPLGALYIERWRPGMEQPISAPYVEGDHAVTLRDLTAFAAHCTTAAELLASVQRYVGADLAPLSTCAVDDREDDDADVVVRLPFVQTPGAPDQH